MFFGLYALEKKLQAECNRFKQITDANLRVIQKNNCSENVEYDSYDDKTEMIFILEGLKKSILNFSQGNVKVL